MRVHVKLQNKRCVSVAGNLISTTHWTYERARKVWLAHYWTEKMKTVFGTCFVKKNSRLQPTILYFPIAHNTLCMPHKLCINYCLKTFLGGLHILKRIVYAKFGKEGGGGGGGGGGRANKVSIGEMENREFFYSLKTTFWIVIITCIGLHR